MLTNGTAYNVTLAGKNADGEGPESDVNGDTTNIIPFTWDYNVPTGFVDAWDADHVVTSGGSVNTFSGIYNGKDLAYVSGTKSTISSTKLPGVNLIAAGSADYAWTGSITVTSNAEFYSTFMKAAAGNGTVYGTSLYSLSLSSVDTLINSIATLTGGASPAGTINLNSTIYDGTQAVGHRAQQWKNGDTTTKGEANDTATQNPLTRINWGDNNGSASFNGGFLRKLVIYAGTVLSSTDRQNVEGALAWDVPFLHYLLPVGHPYYSLNLNGNYTAPATPTIVGISTGDASAKIRVLPQDEGNYGATYTMTSSVSGSGSAAARMTTVSSLTNGSSQTFTCVATNVAGSSSASSASFSVTPASGSNHFTGLIAEFNLAEPTSSWFAFDVSGNYYDTEAFGTPSVVAATNHNVRGTDASGNYFKDYYDALGLLNTDYSIAVHFYPTADGYGTITGSRAGGASINWMLRYDPSDDLYWFSGGATSVKIGTALAKNAWHKIALTYNKTTKVGRYRVDAGSWTTFSFSANPSSTGFPFFIGGDAAATEASAMRISGLRLWNMQKADADMDYEIDTYWVP
jgi:hypothetical protein